MKIGTSSTTRASSGAYTMAEMLLAISITGVLLLANTSAIYFSRMTHYKDQDRGIVSDFLTHYVEQVRSLPFNEVVTNSPINGLYNGVGSAPNIRIPSTTNWFSINTTNYQTFHPDLVWLTNRAPEMRVVLTTIDSGGPHTKHMSVELRWKSPMGGDFLQSRRLDTVRVRDL